MDSISYMVSCNGIIRTNDYYRKYKYLYLSKPNTINKARYMTTQSIE